MYKIIISCVVCVCFLLTGCGAESKLKGEYTKLVEDTQDDLIPVLNLNDLIDKPSYEECLISDEIVNYSKNKWNTEQMGFNNPSGILCREEDVIIADKGNDCLFVYDYEGNLINQIGDIGSGPLEFLAPTGLTSYMDKIYVIDSGNNRIQILTQNFEYIDEVQVLNENDTTITYENIAVGKKGEIYLCGDSLMSRSIDKYENNKLVRIEENFYGSIFGENGQTYAINRGNVCVNPDELEMTVASGKNYLFKIVEDELKVVSELPEGLGINSFVIKNDKLFCSSNTLAKIFAFTMNGEYEETIADFKDLQHNMDLRNYMAINSNGDLLFSNPETGEIFNIVRN